MRTIWQNAWTVLRRVLGIFLDLILIAAVSLILTSTISLFYSVDLFAKTVIPALVELGFALILGCRGRRQLAYIAGICCGVQWSVSVVLYLLSFSLSYVLWYIPLRVAGLTAEIVYYCLCLEKERMHTGKKVAMALAGNIMAVVTDSWIAFDIAVVVTDFLQGL